MIIILLNITKGSKDASFFCVQQYEAIRILIDSKSKKVELLAHIIIMVLPKKPDKPLLFI